MIQIARYALIPIAILQFLVPILPSLGVGETVGDVAVAEGIPPELPLGMFFSIWGIIFTAYLGYAILANTKPEPVTDQLAQPLALAGAGNVIWMLSAQMLASDIINALLLIPILAATWVAAYQLDQRGGYNGLLRRELVCVLTGLLAGWLTVALTISLPNAARELLGLASTDAPWLSLWMALVPAGLLAWVFASRISRSLWYFAAVGWGLTGIFANNWWRTEMHALAIATVWVGSFILWRRLRFGARGSAAA